MIFSCVSRKKEKASSGYMDEQQHLEEIYASLLEKYHDLETYSAWEKDTELMLVIDSRKLNQRIRSTEADYMEKSREILANGQETDGAKYQKKVLNWKKKFYYGVLKIMIRPIRQLL